MTGSVSARSSLAQFGGIEISDAKTFTAAVNPDIKDVPEHVRETIILRARAEKRNGNYDKYFALSACIGIYPPESEDATRIIDPYYDSKHNFSTGEYTHLIGAPGNSG